MQNIKIVFGENLTEKIGIGIFIKKGFYVLFKEDITPPLTVTTNSKKTLYFLKRGKICVYWPDKDFLKINTADLHDFENYKIRSIEDNLKKNFDNSEIETITNNENYNSNDNYLSFILLKDSSSQLTFRFEILLRYVPYFGEDLITTDDIEDKRKIDEALNKIKLTKELKQVNNIGFILWKNRVVCAFILGTEDLFNEIITM